MQPMQLRWEVVLLTIIATVQDTMRFEVFCCLYLQFEYPHIHAKYQNWCQDQCHTTEFPALPEASLPSYAAQTIQNWWRSRIARPKTQDKEAAPSADHQNDTDGGSNGSVVKVISVAGSGSTVRRRRSRWEKLSVHTAAAVIQRAWRRHNVCA